MVPSLPTGWQPPHGSSRLSLTGPLLLPHNRGGGKSLLPFIQHPCVSAGGFVFSYRDNMPFEKKKGDPISVKVICDCSLGVPWEMTTVDRKGSQSKAWPVGPSLVWWEQLDCFLGEIMTYQFSLKVSGSLLTVPCAFSLEPQHHPQQRPELLESWWWKFAGNWATTLWGFTQLQGPSGASSRRGGFLDHKVLLGVSLNSDYIN